MEILEQALITHTKKISNPYKLIQLKKIKNPNKLEAKGSKKMSIVKIVLKTKFQLFN